MAVDQKSMINLNRLRNISSKAGAILRDGKTFLIWRTAINCSGEYPSVIILKRIIMEDQPRLVSAPKNKTIAILLAVLLASWTWVYTYKKDKMKFWIGIIWQLIIFVAIIALVIYVVQTTVGMTEAESTEFFKELNTKVNLGTIITWPISFGIWVWVMIDAIRRPETWYEQYPNVPK